MNRVELEASWHRTRKRFERAVALLALTGDDRTRLASYQENLDHNELELALDDLEEAGDGAIQPPEFWEHLRWAAENMGLQERVETLQRREAEAKLGYVRIAMTLLLPDQGGPAGPIRSGARMPWDIGAQHEGSPMLNDAMLVLVGCRELAPGASATAHLVPLWPEYWKLSPGQRIHAQVGSRRYAEAVVTEQVPAWCPAQRPHPP
jgi:hypothetical protein